VVIFRDALSERIICLGNGVDRSTVRAAEEGVLNAVIPRYLRHDDFSHSAAPIAFDFHSVSFL
jgi:hypothetical protein